MLKFKPKKSFFRLGLAMIILAAIGVFITFQLDYSGGGPPRWGVTFTPAYAQSLGLDWRQTYVAILDDLGVDTLRLGAYWNEIESTRGVYDFSSLDWQIEQAAQRDATVLLAVGMRLPRWPECHQPDWAKDISVQEHNDALFDFVEAVIVHYQNNPAVTAWQVENEPLLRWFGQCPPPNKAVFKKEIELVRKTDPTRPIVVTDSGELSSWQTAAAQADILGTTMYRIVWNKYLGFFEYWFLPPAGYRWKADFTKLLNKNLRHVIVTELQMEPWATDAPLTSLTLEQQQRSFDVAQFKDNIQYVSRTGFETVYLWGVEYWYWLAQNNHPELWQEAKKLWD